MTELEQAILEALLAGEHQELVVLREQARVASASERQLTGVGFLLQFTVPPGAPRLATGRMVLSDVGAELLGVRHGAGFVLFLQDGVLHTLEGFTYADEWPAEAQLVRWWYLHPKVTGSAQLVETKDRDLAYALSRKAD